MDIKGLDYFLKETSSDTHLIGNIKTPEIIRKELVREEDGAIYVPEHGTQLRIYKSGDNSHVEGVDIHGGVPDNEGVRYKIALGVGDQSASSISIGADNQEIAKNFSLSISNMDAIRKHAHDGVLRLLLGNEVIANSNHLPGHINGALLIFNSKISEKLASNLNS